MNLGLRTILLLVAVVLFVLAIFSDTRLARLASRSGSQPSQVRSSATRSAGASARSTRRAARHRPKRRSMPKVPAPGEDHRGAGALDRGDDLARPASSRPAGSARSRPRRARAAGRPGTGRTRPRRATRRRASGRARRLLDGDPDGVDAAHLAGADADRLQVLGDHDRVRADVLADAPGEEQVAPLRLVGLARDDLPSPRGRRRPSRGPARAGRRARACSRAPTPRLRGARGRSGSGSPASAHERLHRHLVVAGREEHLDELLGEPLAERGADAVGSGRRRRRRQRADRRRGRTRRPPRSRRRRRRRTGSRA